MIYKTLKVKNQPPFTTVGFVIQVLLQRKTENCASLESVQSSKIEKQQLIWLTYIIIILIPVLLFKKEHFVHCSLIIISLYHYSIYSWLLFSYKNSLLWSTIINFIKDLTTFLFSIPLLSHVASQYQFVISFLTSKRTTHIDILKRPIWTEFHQLHEYLHNNNTCNYGHYSVVKNYFTVSYYLTDKKMYLINYYLMTID